MQTGLAIWAAAVPFFGCKITNNNYNVQFFLVSRREKVRFFCVERMKDGGSESENHTMETDTFV